MRRSIRRIRGKAYPANVPLSELHIQGEQARTVGEDPQQFLLRDNMDEENRVIVFCSPPCLALLATESDWFCDGNFAMAYNY